MERAVGGEGGESSFKAKRGRPPKSDQDEMTTLRQENDRLREEVEILKKAAAYFAQDLKLSTPSYERTGQLIQYRFCAMFLAYQAVVTMTGLIAR